ncbi:MAG: sorbosone dehydrogenase family protein [Acidobacteria bacterium]|nr:sorbosone dehydrogenase family protein [Acidobacteriota bacterium]MCA1620424.1 sorbosone dehydrogenase family protein [Acidobacteriota bacterium]
MRKTTLTVAAVVAASASAWVFVGGDVFARQRRAGRAAQERGRVLTGQGAFGDWTSDAPGVRRRITAADLPRPYATRSVDAGSRVVPRPEGAWPKAPAGFRVEEFASGLENPRLIRTAPNGDLFVAESRPGRVRVLRAAPGAGKAETVEVFAEGLRRPFGIAFYPAGPDPRYVYVANTDSVVRFPYRSGDLKARGPAETVVANLPGGGQLRGGGHWTRDIAFSNDGRRMFVSVGSLTNVWEKPEANEERRATILEFKPDGTGERTFAWGIRNAVGIAVHPRTGELWASVNERDGLGDDLVPDYVTRVRDGGFYGWPWFYLGANQDPRHPGARPELRPKVIAPDVLLQSHSASLEMAFYTGRQFPREYEHDAFAALHGSWNRAKRTGYKVVRVPQRGGVPTGEYEDFLTGFVTPEGQAWGRPVGVAVARDGALFVSDDGSNAVWRVSYAGR